jgi:hypothetical protein
MVAGTAVPSTGAVEEVISNPPPSASGLTLAVGVEVPLEKAEGGASALSLNELLKSGMVAVVYRVTASLFPDGVTT